MNDQQVVLRKIRADLAGVVGTRPFHEVVDLVHERLLGSGVAEEDALEVNRQLRAAVKPPVPKFRTFEVFLTRYCNLDCPYCSVHSKNLDRMPNDTANAALKFMLEQWDPDHFVDVIFMGGEPTSAFPLLKRMVLAIEKEIPIDPQKYRYDVTTNGTLLTEEMMSFFAAHNVRVLLSVDGDRETHDEKRRWVDGRGSFDMIVERLPMIRRYQPYLGARMTPTAQTIGRLLYDVKALVALGFRKLIIGPATGVEWPPEALRTLKEQANAVLDWKKRHQDLSGLSISLEEVSETASCGGDDFRWGCRAGRTGLAIDIDGTVFPCSKIIGTDKPRGSQLRMGDVFKGITEEDTHLKLNGHVPVAKPGCWSCEVRGSCLGGCFAANIEATGSAFSPAFETCEVTKTLLELGRERADVEEKMAAHLAGNASAGAART